MVPEQWRDEERELADAMERGARNRPQAFGSYFTWDGKSCALGAAFEGVHRLPDLVGSLHPNLERLWHCLEYVVRRCPIGCRKRLPLAAMIVHLNDDHQWSREAIADWLRQNGDEQP